MIIYLATPYSHQSASAREARFKISCQVAAWAMRQGHTVFCPIAHSHPIAEFLPEELLMDHEFWMNQDLPMLHMCDELWVYPNDAADVSNGVAREIAESTSKGIPVRYVSPKELDIIPITQSESLTDEQRRILRVCKINADLRGYTDESEALRHAFPWLEVE